MKSAAIILAAGRGTRVGTELPKQFLPIAGKPILSYTLDCFENSEVDEIILVCGYGQETWIHDNLIERFHYKKISHIVIGGKERKESVLCGLRAVTDAQLVLIHDGARPFISEKLIADIIQGALSHGAAVPGIPLKDTLKLICKRVDNLQEMNTTVLAEGTVPRESLVCVQTPQVFYTAPIKEAYEAYFASSHVPEVTDDAGVYEWYFEGKKPVCIVMGEERNIKITTPLDLKLAELLIHEVEM